MTTACKELCLLASSIPTGRGWPVLQQRHLFCPCCCVCISSAHMSRHHLVLMLLVLHTSRTTCRSADILISHVLLTQLCTVCRIKVLRLQNNLTGCLPSTWVAPTILSYTIDLDLGFNQLIGTLPGSWGTGLPLGEYLNLDKNMLTGERCDAAQYHYTWLWHCTLLC
jgi:hypothetical protein